MDFGTGLDYLPAGLVVLGGLGSVMGFLALVERWCPPDAPERPDRPVDRAWLAFVDSDDRGDAEYEAALRVAVRPFNRERD